MIVITAPTGSIGSQTVEALIADDRPVRVIARSPERLDPSIRERVEVVQGSHDDPVVLTAALTGADSLLWLVPPDPTAADIEAHYRRFTRAARDAIAAQGVPRVVGITSLGRAYGKHAGLLSPAFTMDAMLESTGVAYRALAMPFFMENLLNQAESIRMRGTFAMPNAADRPLATVATRDIASLAARLLSDDTWTGQSTVPVIGPDALTPDEMARVLTDALDRPVQYRQVAADEYKAKMMSFGMSDAWAQGLVDMAEAQSDGIYDPEHRSMTAPAPTGFHEWVRDVLRPIVAV